LKNFEKFFILKCNYNNDEFIIRQYAKGDTFYVIMKGRAKQTKCASKWEEGKFVRYLNRGDFFGEDALIA
jgi:CRP-like cAMP-binding protein